jgi:PAS domain S-box-containing protein
MARDVVIENMDDGVIVLDISSRIVDVNPSAMMITGISKKDIGRSVLEVCPNLTKNIEEIARSEKKHMEIHIGDADDMRVFDFRLSLIKDRWERCREVL